MCISVKVLEFLSLYPGSGVWIWVGAQKKIQHKEALGWKPENVLVLSAQSTPNVRNTSTLLFLLLDDEAP